MGSDRYRAGVLQGCKLGGSSHGFFWPDEIAGLGPRKVGPLARCKACGSRTHLFQSMTFVSYGGKPPCLRHAVEGEKDA